MSERERENALDRLSQEVAYAKKLDSAWIDCVLVADVEELLAALASSPPSGGTADTRDAEIGSSLRRLMKVDGAGWSVRHPRDGESDDAWYFGFGFPLTHAQVLDAVERGGLGWAPDFDTAFRNAADAFDAARSADSGRSDA